MSKALEFLRTELFTNIRYWKIETWSLIIAAVALMQPWLVSLLKRVFKAGKVEIYETGLPEVGYSSYGATMGLYGTLRSRDRDLFIRLTELDILRLRDQSLRRFEWIAFRPLTTVVGRVVSELEVTLPAGFMLLTSQPHQYNIMFSDPTVREEIQAILRSIQEKWLAKVTASDKVNRLAGKATDQAKVRALLQELYSEFALTPEHEDAQNRIRSFAIWQAGVYKVTLRVHTAKPTRTYKKSWFFELSEADQEALEANSSKVLQELCTESFVPHYFAFPRYIYDTLPTRLLLNRKKVPR